MSIGPINVPLVERSGQHGSRLDCTGVPHLIPFRSRFDSHTRPHLPRRDWPTVSAKVFAIPYAIALGLECKSLDLAAKSGDHAIKRQATWGMSVNTDTFKFSKWTLSQIASPFSF